MTSVLGLHLARLVFCDDVYETNETVLWADRSRNLHPHELGQAVFQYWSEIPHHHHHTTIDEFIVMPNHIHGIIIIVEVLDTEVSHVGTLASEGSHVETLHATSLPSPARPSISPQKGSLCVILRSFKTALTCCARMNGYPNFAWQPRFHDHIIRNENALYLNHKKSAPGRAFSCTYSLSKKIVR